MSTAGHHYAKHTWPEINEAVSSGRVIVIPVGAIEQHGPHLPVDTDNLIIEAVCDSAARVSGGLILVVPPIHYGFNDHNMDFPGTVSIKAETFIRYCYDVAASFAHQGFTEILFANGHGSNAILLEVAARQVTVDYEVRCGSVSWWSLATEAADRIRESPVPGGMSHAGEAETSLYLHLEEAAVRKEAMAAEIWSNGSRFVWHDLFHWSPGRFVDFHSKRSESGVFGDPTVASADKGLVLIEAAAGALADFARELRELDWGERRNHRVAGPSAATGSEWRGRTNGR
jgi:creatinine amidohydrolase